MIISISILIAAAAIAAAFLISKFVYSLQIRLLTIAKPVNEKPEIPAPSASREELDFLLGM